MINYEKGKVFDFFLRIANELVSAFRELWPFCLCRRPPWPRKGGGQCPHGLHNYVTCLLLPWSPAKILSLCKMTAYGQGGKGQASFYNYVTRSLVSLSKSTARGVTKTLCAKEMKRMNICTISVVLVFSRLTEWCLFVEAGVDDVPHAVYGQTHLGWLLSLRCNH